MSSVVCKEVFDDNYQPSIEEIFDYATKISIDPEFEPHLLYLAKEGLLQALPKEWKICYNEEMHAHYYYNENTKVTQWEHPLDEVYRQLADQVRQNTKATTPNSIVSDESSQLDSGIKSQEKNETDNMEGINLNVESKLEKEFVIFANMRNKPKNTYLTQLQVHNNIQNEDSYENEYKLSASGTNFLKSNTKNNENLENNEQLGEKKSFEMIEQNFKGILRDTNTLDAKKNDDEMHLVATDEKKSVRFNLHNTKMKTTELPQENLQFTNLENFTCDNYSKINKNNKFQPIYFQNEANLTNINLTSEKRFFGKKSPPGSQNNLLDNEYLKRKTVDNYIPIKTYVRETDELVKQKPVNNHIFENENKSVSSLTSQAFEENINDGQKLVEKEIVNENLEKIVSKINNEKKIHIPGVDLLKAPLTNSDQDTNKSFIISQNLNKEIANIKLNYAEDLRVMRIFYDTQLNEAKLNCEKKNNVEIEELNEQLAQDLAKARNEILTNHKIAMNVLQKNHSEILEDLERDLKSEEALIRKEHSNKLMEMKMSLNEELKIEKQKMKETGDDRLYEKIRCEKRLLEDKYKCLKEKYIKLKTDVRLSLERRNRRREQIAKNHQSITTTASEIEKSVTNKQSLRNTSEMNSLSLSTSYPDHYHFDKSSNTIKSYVTDKTDKASKKLNISSKYIQQLQVQYNDDTTSLSYSDTTISNKDCRSKCLQNSGNQYHNDETENNNNNQKDCLKVQYNAMKSASELLLNEHLKLDRSFAPVESLRQQLQTLDDLEDLFPDNALDSYHLRYPFADSTQHPGTNSTELEFFKHRIHLERETLRRAKESLRSQRTNFRIRQRDIKQKYKLLNSNITLEQLTREEKELAEIEVNLHRTKSLLGEKVIRLRHLEKSICIIYEKQKPLKFFLDDRKEDATLSDLSSHSSSGFSSNELGTDPNAFLNRSKELSSRPSDAIQNLEILNAEIYEILLLLKSKTMNETYRSSDVNWLESSQTLISSSNSNNTANFINMYSGFGERSENHQNCRLTPSVLTASPRAITYTSNLVERVRDLKNWLTQAKLDYEIVLANNFRLSSDGAGDNNVLDASNNPN